MKFVLEEVCGFDAASGMWARGSQVGSEWSRSVIGGGTLRPRAIWRGPAGGLLPCFIDGEPPRVGIGRGRKAVSGVLQWLRAGGERLALITNGRQWRLLFAGVDFDAWCEADVDLWLEEGQLSEQVTALRTLLQPALWTPPSEGEPGPLAAAVLDSRRGQAELSEQLGERVREAVELLVHAHGEALQEECAGADPAEIYSAAVRVVMRLVVLFFAESRGLLPRDNRIFHGSYGLSGILGDLQARGARHPERLRGGRAAWPRLLALFRLLHRGSWHPELPVAEYGGELFAPGDPESADGMQRALAVFERACFGRETPSDLQVLRLLERISRTSVRIRQGRTSVRVTAPVDFSDLSTEYVGILYEGLLDFELRTAPPGDPVLFLSVGNQPALPLSRLEAMDDAALRNLVEKLKKKDAEEEGEEAEAGEEEADTAPDAEGEPGEEAEEGAEQPEPETIEFGDERRAVRTRAEAWARRTVAAAGLAPKLRGRPTPERLLGHEERTARFARSLVAKVVLPGEWHLVRWGGTRKGSGTFYTRPGLAVPTVRRTLRPLCYEGSAPRLPEEILELKIVDPGCGSGTFLVAALRFLTDALYAALHHHGRIRADGDRSVVALLGGKGAEDHGIAPLSAELLPCPPDAPEFEPRLKAVLRRHVVERCLYGVDLDPLAVELCRLSLWLETMDRELPFSFLDHKVVCGNSLVGAWLDRYRHYPAMAWKNREKGDKGHARGVHYPEEGRTRALKAFVRDRLTPDLRRFLEGPNLFDRRDPLEALRDVQRRAGEVLERLHELPVHHAAERARRHRELIESPGYAALRSAMDLWCACWFWPAEELEHAPLPTAFASPAPATRAVAARIAARERFLHWELQFPDVFSPARSGFDAVLGNPPWNIAKPNSKEFFSSVDPLYRSYGKQEALERQTGYFADEEIERAWLDYCAGFKSLSHWCAHACRPFGDPEGQEGAADRFAIARGAGNGRLHARWRRARGGESGLADPAHPFRHQGSADLNLYKLFLEQAHALLRPGGRLGFIVPSGLYADHGTRALRELFLDSCRWEWIFGFENRRRIFPIHGSFKFNPVIVEKGGGTEAIQAAFMRRRLEDWEEAERHAVPYAREQVERFSPHSKAILEIQSARDLQILEKIYANSVLLGDQGPNGWGITFTRELDKTKAANRLRSRGLLQSRGLIGDLDDLFTHPVRDRLRRAGFVPVWEGKCCYFDRWIREPSEFIREAEVSGFLSGAFPFGVRRIARNTDERTLIPCIVPPGTPTMYTIEVCRAPDATAGLAGFALVQSIVIDLLVRMRVNDSVPLGVLHSLPVPVSSRGFATRLATLAFRMLASAASSPRRLGYRICIETLAFSALGLTLRDVRHVLRDCDTPVVTQSRGRPQRELPVTGFWRMDNDKDPELRHTVLTQVAFHDLEEKIRACGGDREKGIEAFLAQNDGEGWLLPETLRLADYGLGHDERALVHQPVVSRFGPGCYDSPVGSTPRESRRECHVDARNLLGEEGYRRLLDQLEGRSREDEGRTLSDPVQPTAPGPLSEPAEGPPVPSSPRNPSQPRLFE